MDVQDKKVTFETTAEKKKAGPANAKNDSYMI